MTEKYTGPVRFRFFGNEQKAQQQVGQARFFLGLMKEAMSFQGLKFLAQEYVDGLGNTFRCVSNANGLAPIDEVSIYSTGGGGESVVTGFIVRAKSINLPQVEGVASSNIRLFVRYLDDLEAAQWFYWDGTPAMFADNAFFNGQVWTNYYAEYYKSPPDSNSYYQYTDYPNDFSIGVADWPHTADISALTPEPSQELMDAIMAVPWVPKTSPNTQIWSPTYITQSDIKPRVRFFGSDYEMQDDGKIKILNPWSDPFDVVTCTAAVLKKADYTASAFVDEYRGVSVMNFNWVVMNDLFGTEPWFIAITPIPAGINPDTGLPWTINDTQYQVTFSISDFVATANWQMFNDTGGKYEVFVLSAVANADIELDFLWYGRNIPKKQKFDLSAKTYRNTATESDFIGTGIAGYCTDKFIIDVEKPKPLTTEPNPHIKREPL